MHPKSHFWLLMTILLTTSQVTWAQAPAKVPRIGYLNASSASSAASRVEAFRQGMRELGYVDGKNIVVEYRFAEGNLDRLSQLLAELVKLNVDMIVSGGPTVTRPAKAATSTIPIVMGFDDDPIGSGFVANLARPGGNITGLSTLAPEISGKQLEILKEIIAKLARVAVLGSSMRSEARSLKEMELAGTALKVQIQYLDIQESKDIETAFAAASKARADAVVVLGSPTLNLRRTHVIDLAVNNRIPGVYAQPEYVEAGGLMYYGPSFTDIFRRAATYVDKILKGAKPADLPVEHRRSLSLSSI